MFININVDLITLEIIKLQQQHRSLLWVDILFHINLSYLFYVSREKKSLKTVNI